MIDRLQVCLFGNSEVSLRDAMRDHIDDSALKEVRRLLCLLVVDWTI